MKKTIFAFFLIIIINTNLFSAVFEKTNDLKILQSEHFDIVFDDESSSQAFLIYQECENLYKEITTFFGLKRDQHINVAITSDIDSFNAYFGIYPSPRIVLYNTIDVNNNFNYFSSDYILYLFKHELTHAITLMSENNFVTKTFSQMINFAFLNITLFNAEGFAVLSESQNGEGRLNSNLYKSRLLEAKAENKFLKFNEVQANRDVYPRNVFYLYGSFFNQYLLKTYGIDKYRKYINQLHKFNLFFINPNSSFKEIYNLDIYSVYKDFENSFIDLELKNIEYFSYDYLADSIIKYNDKILVYQSINNSIRDIKTNKKIATYLDNPYFISSNDDKIILSAFIKKDLDKTTTYVIDKSNKKQYLIPNFKMAINYNDSLVGIYNEGQQQYIAFYKNGTIYDKISSKKDEFIQKIDVYNDKIVYLSTYKKSDRINIVEDENIIRTYSFEDENIEIVDFSISYNKIVLSTIDNNQLPRLSYIDLVSTKAYINYFDTLGGVYNPILFDNDVYYIAKLSEKNELRHAKISQFNFIEKPLKVKVDKIYDNLDNLYEIDISNVKKYNKFKYVLDGSFFPFVLPNDSFDKIVAHIYFESMDPTESLNTKFLYNVNLYDNFNSNMILTFSNVTNYKAKSFKIDYKVSYSDLINTSLLNLEYQYSKVYDLINDRFLLFKSKIKTIDFDYYLSDFEFGYNFSTNLGPNKENYFSYSINYLAQTMYDSTDQSFLLNNNISAKVYIPYLFPFLDFDNVVLNMPFKISYLYNFEEKSNSLNLSILLFKKEIQSSFERIPIYFNNIESYVNYNFSDKIISLYSLFTTSITQTRLNEIKLYPGFNYTYDIPNNKFEYRIGLFTSF